MSGTPPPLRGKSIAVIVCDYPLGTSTMLINSIALLARDNQVDVIVSRADKEAVPCDDWLAKLCVLYPSYGRWLPVRGCKFLLQRFARIARLPAWWWVWALGNLDLLLFSGWLGRRLRERRYDLLIAVECFSLIAAARAGTAGADVLYFNLELLDWAPENPLYLNKPVLKRLEHEALGVVKHVMITSPERGRIFAQMNGFPAERVSALPVAALARPLSGPVGRGRHFRERFAIPADCLLVLYAGNFEPWAQCVEIIEAMDRWPAGTVLVMHTWNRKALQGGYFRRMQQAAAGRAVHFSSDYLRHEALAPALSSADIGLLFYQAIDANFTEILFSSNKMAEYMAAGLPVVCSPFPSLRKFVEEEGIGLAAEPADAGGAVRRIAADLEGYRARVARCRERHFEFERYFTAAFQAYARIS